MNQGNGESAAPPSDVEQRRALNEQVKLLLKTEQQLHRSQNALDRQLIRVELLSSFALQWDSRSSVAEILAGAMKLFRKLFHVEKVVAVRTIESLEHDASPDPGGVPLIPAWNLETALTGCSGPIVEKPDSLSADLQALLFGLGLLPEAVGSRAVVVVLPLRGGTDAHVGALAAYCSDSTRGLGQRDAPSAAAAPFLRIVASHLEHTIKNSHLLDDLERAQRQLLQARNELEERVEIRTRELTREVAERRRAEEQLILARDAAEEASRAKSAFVANMSHELRTPLNAIIGYSELIRETASGLDGETLDDLDRILLSSRHLLRMINDVLDLSKIGAGRMVLERQPFDAGVLVCDAVATMERVAAKKGNRLESSTDGELGTMIGDSTRVTQILLNILGNSAKFTENGTIRLDVTRRAQSGRDVLVFRIEDSGIGMTPEQLARAFGEFTQADSSTTRKYGGSGLGLTISQNLCRLMGGTIEATSTPGVGSVFHVTIPAVLEASPACQAA